ncbi:2-oxoglutarate dehydrogenase E1 component [Planctomyces sp. SH-PL62]|uniref:2-oxoglutarate dehydrogenase E1 component n=1 Tax=Planctomyces sp. SH-PL62 TaxID=1636152 RepID=UPI00078B7F95|nr:2-oxoglutarate dehydrogenase E1 component [Planctomyces sp. SH-PL62]AMV37626.1 Multifunctional 2-oxoglutarate metabolism enzyme [Planctomyces sp. SH-PL62]
MTPTSVVSRANLDLVEAYQRRWREDPASVDESWRNFFEGYDLGASLINPAAAPYGDAPPPAQQSVKAVTRLVDAYREMGHNLADLDPLKLTPRRLTDEQLELANFGLSEADLDRDFYTKFGEEDHGTLREILSVLRDTYCRTIGVEYMHIRDLEIRRWLFERMEPVRNNPRFDLKKKRRIIYKLNEAELFETFLHKNFVGQKRFSLEGGEMLIPLLDAIIERAGGLGVQEIVMGMPHRGRLNVLANILHKPYGLIFSEFEGNMPETVAGDGDVKYHLGFSADHVTQDRRTVHLTLTPNPSHLEAVNPVVEGRMRAKQRRAKDALRKLGAPILIHGDAAFAGQGLVAETLNLSQLPGYRTGGTIHIVVNNQIGFTTSPSEGRSTRYCTDVAKMIEVPIFHVNGEDPEAVVFVGELATDFRQQFGRDVVIDMVCYRRHGHNEGDEPGFTQPLMYDNIKNRISVREMYTERLVTSGELTSKEAESVAETFAEKLQQVLEEVKREGVEPRTAMPGYSSGPWSELTPHYSFEPVETGVGYDVLKKITSVAASPPTGFTPNHKLVRIFKNRVAVMEEKGGVDWAFAESLAFGSLLLEETPVRLSGQDSRRGTFSQRHAVLIDQLTGQPWIPLNNLGGGQAQFCVYDSLLSEAAVLGFDYGYSLDEPSMLIMWEAQFGDFANGAQVIIDQFIASAESKWGRGSGLVMLLPHGYEGQGPEHSSARLERFLQLCAEDNIQVCVPSTPAQYFHMLRRQVRRNFRKPLIVMTPKSLLRRKEAVSPVDRLVDDRFHDVLDDSDAPRGARRLLLCSGKVYYDLAAKRAELGKEKEVAIVRLEQPYPFPAQELKQILDGYPDVRDWVWVQEESQNMGAWTFVAPRLEELMGLPFQYVGRDASASPATGSKLVHDREQSELVEAAVGAAVPHLVSATPVRALAAAGSREGVR